MDINKMASVSQRVFNTKAKAHSRNVLTYWFLPQPHPLGPYAAPIYVFYLSDI